MNYLWCLISGLLTGAAQPGNLFSFFVWFSLIFYFRAMANSKKTFQRFLCTLIFSYSMLLVTMWWQYPVLTTNIPQVLGKYPAIFGAFGFLLEILVLTIPYFFIWILSELYYRKPRKNNYWSQVIFYTLSFTAAEIIKELGELAFSGGSLGYVLFDHKGLIQIVPYLGYYSLTLLIVFINTLVAFDEPKNTWKKVGVAFAIIYTINFGVERLLPLPSNQNQLKISGIHLDIPQEVKYNIDPLKNYEMLDNYIVRAQKQDSELIVLPESSFLTDITDLPLHEVFKTLIKNGQKPLIIAYPRFEGNNYYNSAWYYDKDGNRIGNYNKVKLTPFAEILPYKNIFESFSMFKLLNYCTPGDKYKVFDVNGKKFGVQICFETYFPEVSANLTKNGAQVLIAITNDGWFDVSTALDQHFSQLVFRALENRRDIVQISNRGITGMVDKYGRIVKATSDRVKQVDLYTPGLNTEETIINKIAPYLKIAIFVGALIFAIL